ncbi:hypothetical protein MJA45_26760 [Paenibacillus aurantius]|uniref:Uncharacterized protein n=1 Tax=Paenibacillus aurantius TaxID=2918900 RepID=A0AA96RHJ0_9BACL|nr:hypothetical protein [Paenibacillus aurantius]WNQ11159.1 hypothetical protein MJA45_26760 [Paenibacillus aurantius]
MKKIGGLIVLVAALWGGTGSAGAEEGGYTPVPKSPDTHPSYIRQLFTKQGHTYITADYIQWFEGEEADQAFRVDEPDAGLDYAPSGYYIRNVNPKLRTLEVAANVQVWMQTYDRSGKWTDDLHWNTRQPLSVFRTLLGEDPLAKEYPYHLTVKNGKVVRIVQQYIP